jgi:6-phosphogluconolactonase
MSVRTACAASGNQVSLRRVLATTIVFFLASFFISCGRDPNPISHATNQIAYVTLPTEGSVLVVQINGANGHLNIGVKTPQQSGTSPSGLAVLSKKYLYVANSQSNNISIFNIASDGSLSLSGTPTPAGTGPYGAAIDPSGKYLLITNTFSNNVSVFAIDSSSGALAEVPGSPFFANNSPTEILVSPTGNFVYVTNPPIGMVTAFAFSTATGALTPVPGSPYLSGSGASSIVLSPNGNYIYVANSSALNLDSTTVGNISGFNVNSSTGVLTPISGSPFTSPVGTGPSALVFDPNGQFLFATTPGTSYTIWCFNYDGTTGQLTSTPGAPFSVSGGGLFAVIDTSGNFFYIGSQESTGIAGYTYDPNTGQPTVLTNSPFSTGVAPGKMVISYP